MEATQTNPPAVEREEAWTPLVKDGSTDDRQLVVIYRQQLRHSPLRRGDNVMEARFARFIVSDAIKHHAKNLPYLFFIEPANETERAKSGHRPLSEGTKARLLDARRNKIEMRRTCRIEDVPSELPKEATLDVAEYEGDTAMSNLAKKVTNGVKGLRTKKAAKRAAEKKPAAKKAAPKKPAVEKKVVAPAKPKRQWSVQAPTGTPTGPF